MLFRQALCRIIVKDLSGRKHIWCGTVYRDPNFSDNKAVVETLQRVFG